MPAGLRGAGRKVGPQPTSDRGRKERNARQHSTGRCFPGFPPLGLQYGDGSTLLRRLQNFAYVYEGSNQCEMLLLPYCEPCTKGNQSVGPYQLWQLQNCADVSLWSSSVKCALCQYVTNAANPSRSPVPLQRPDSAPSSSTSSQTVVVENPMSMDESGKLVSSVVVGITTEKRS
ncbi:hypothetical protein MLD38_010378 [Melastoma candidum]|uniref:Uncharacterized protein n=1 Tax=Melastoma candidum TaxID=119954 RepID=A0ACB9R0P7_9MYRT|nr:hypothetical protein MLD38_010378 [Melastoma candidum]